MGVPDANVSRLLEFVEIVTVAIAVTICYNKRSEATRKGNAMYNIDKTIKELNTALVLLDAFGDGHEFTMHHYKELAATTNELFGDRYSDSNVCYSVKSKKLEKNKNNFIPK